jgi:Ni/Fe-hydrogenase 1 B-type cytochrome subunit
MTQETTMDETVSPKDAHQTESLRSVYVYEAPVRIWHWINALAMVVLAVTGYFIGKPLPSMPGEASANFLMGYIRFAHFAAAYIFAIGMILRVYWAFVGNYHAREMFWLPIFRAYYWKGFLSVIKWYLFLITRPTRYLGHNPVARLAMFLYMLMSVFMIVTGFALYAEGKQSGSWPDVLFGWVIPFMGQSLDVHNWHRLGMWSMIVFVVIHIYSAIREDIMGRASIVSTMISGHRTFKG